MMMMIKWVYDLLPNQVCLIPRFAQCIPQYPGLQIPHTFFIFIFIALLLRNYAETRSTVMLAPQG